MVVFPLDPAVVRLSGKIHRETFAGPPNYHSIEQGEQPETYCILHLAEPIQVENGYNTGNAPTVTADRLQLVFMGQRQRGTRSEGSTGNVGADIDQLLAIFAEAGQNVQREYDKHEHLVSKQVTVTGMLFQENTVHHKTRVLITVQDIAEA